MIHPQLLFLPCFLSCRHKSAGYSSAFKPTLNSILSFKYSWGILMRKEKEEQLPQRWKLPKQVAGWEGNKAGAEQLGRAVPDSSGPLRLSRFWGKEGGGNTKTTGQELLLGSCKDTLCSPTAVVWQLSCSCGLLKVVKTAYVAFLFWLFQLTRSKGWGCNVRHELVFLSKNHAHINGLSPTKRWVRNRGCGPTDLILPKSQARCSMSNEAA